MQPCLPRYSSPCPSGLLSELPLKPPVQSAGSTAAPFDLNSADSPSTGNNLDRTHWKAPGDGRPTALLGSSTMGSIRGLNSSYRSLPDHSHRQDISNDSSCEIPRPSSMPLPYNSNSASPPVPMNRPRTPESVGPAETPGVSSCSSLLVRGASYKRSPPLLLCNYFLTCDIRFTGNSVFSRPEYQYRWSRDVRKALTKVFKLTEFRQNQLEAINAALSGKDCFILMVSLRRPAWRLLLIDIWSHSSRLEGEKVYAIRCFKHGGMYFGTIAHTVRF